MFNVDQSIDYLSGSFASSETSLPQESQKPQSNQPQPQAIKFKSDSQGQSDLISQHQKYIDRTIRESRVNPQLANIYKDFLQTRLKIVFLVEDKEGFQKQEQSEEVQRIVKQIDLEIKKQQQFAEDLSQKFESQLGKFDFKTKQEYKKIGEMLFMQKQPVEHNKIEGCITHSPSLNRFYSDNRSLNAFDKRALEQLNESKNTFLPPEVNTDLKTAMLSQSPYVREQVVMQQPPRQTQQVQQRPNMRVVPNQSPQRGLPQQSSSKGLDQDAIAILSQHVDGKKEKTVTPTQIVLGLGLLGGVGMIVYNKFLKE